jgi:kynurenine formamidase
LSLSFNTKIHQLGRGILIDYAHWAASQSPPITYSTFSTHAISFSTLLAICKSENVTPKRGDILFIRTGVIPEWDSFSDRQKKDYAAQREPEHAGMEASIELLEWLWDSGISAVAGDAISWEVSATSFFFILSLGGNFKNRQSLEI